MMRVLAGAAAWAAGTVLAAGLAWFGAGMVVRDAAASPSVAPVIAAPASASAVPSPRATSGGSSGVPADLRSYTLAGGRVILRVTGTSATLVSAVPDSAYTVQNWSGAGWLRVDFSSGTRVSSLIASWNGHAPSVIVTN